MNKIVRTGYPASRLPVDLRGDFPDSARVSVIIEEAELPPAPTMDEIRAMRDSLPAAEDDASERIRKLRDEWE